jgi:hypothetical protein
VNEQQSTDQNTEDSGGQGSEDSESSVNSEGTQDKATNKGESVGDSAAERTHSIKKNSTRVRSRSSPAVQSADQQLAFLRKNSQIRDTKALRDELLNSTDFGGLKASINLIFNCLENRIYKNWTDAQIRQYLFALGCRRETSGIMLDRLNLYAEMLALRIMERIKTESDWRE